MFNMNCYVLRRESVNVIKLLRSILRYDFKWEIRCFSPSLRVAVPSPLQGETEVRELLRYRFTLVGEGTATRRLPFLMAISLT